MLDQTTANNIAEAIGKAEPFVAPINPLLPIGLGIVAKIIQMEPKFELALRALFAKPTLTQADFDAAIEHIRMTSYEQLCPHSELAKYAAQAPDPSTQILR